MIILIGKLILVMSTGGILIGLFPQLSIILTLFTLAGVWWVVREHNKRK
jgi:hypothetical protein